MLAVAPLVLALAGCMVGEPAPMQVTRFSPQSLRADRGGDVILWGIGLIPRMRFDAQNGEVVVEDDGFALLLDGRAYPATWRSAEDDGDLAVRVRPREGEDQLPLERQPRPPRAVSAVLIAATGAEAALPDTLLIDDPSPPFIEGVVPSLGGDGAEVVIHGDGFGSGIEFLFGETRGATVLEVVDPKTARVQVPAGVAGRTVDVMARNAGAPGLALKIDAFTYED